MRKHLLFCLLFYSFIFYGQDVSVVLSTSETSSRVVEASGSITLLPGFSTNSYVFGARIVASGSSSDPIPFNEVVGSPYNLNENLNWISSSSYNLGGALTASGISYFNDLGKATQSQSLDIKTGKIWANEVRYDEFGRAVFNTLSSPTGTSYGYKSTFITKSNGSPFTQSDLAAIKDNTSDIQLSTQAGKAGWYYSEHNNSEAYQDVTNYPYSRTIYSTLNPGIGLRTLGGNKIKRTPSSTAEWLQSYSFTMPMAQEPFYSFGLNYFPGRDLVVKSMPNSKPNSISTGYYRYNLRLNCDSNNPIITDVRLDQNLVLTQGRVYYMHVPVGSGANITIETGYYKVINSTYVNNSTNGDGDPFLDGNSNNTGTPNVNDFEALGSLINTETAFYCPEGRPYYIQGSKTVVRDVHGVESVVFKDSNDNVLAAARSGNEDNLERAKRKVITPIGYQRYADIHIPVGCGGTANFRGINGAIFKVFDLITESVVANNVQGSIVLQPGMYRVVLVNNLEYNPQNPFVTISSGGVPSLLDASDTVGIEYFINYYDYSLNYYDKTNRLVKSTQPLSSRLESTFTYNTLGQLLETSNTDEGSAQFKYRKDGQIRFSQNTKQEALGEFSYTNYDHLARPKESGVALGDFTALDADTTLAASLTGQKEQHFTVYDEADTTLESILTTANFSECALNYKQQFLAGNVSKTYTANPSTTTTWYGYDVYGRVKWMLQDIEGLGVKSIDYDYDFATGQVTKVYYQKCHQATTASPLDETFIHRYTYNIAGELYKVETSNNDTNFTEQAKYTYYETGALKRVEIAKDLQGIDYVYNLNGQLKAINHPSRTSSLDPGGDGANGISQDLFGFAIDYYNGDYTRTNTPTPITSTSQGVNQFNGNIKATRWSTNGINTNTQSAQMFNYNKNNWLAGADFGTAQNTGAITLGNDYKVSNITYDANGNIQTLNRNKNTEGGSNQMDALTYKYNPYKKNRLTKVIDAVGATPTVDDIETQDDDNYIYNTIGQLVANKQDNALYSYTASGLVSKIFKATPTATNDYFPIYKENFSSIPRVDVGVLNNFTPPNVRYSPNWMIPLPRRSTLIVTERLHCLDLAPSLRATLENGSTTPKVTKVLSVLGAKEHQLTLDLIRWNNTSGLTPLNGLPNNTQNPIKVTLRTSNGTILATNTLPVPASYPLCGGEIAVQPVTFTFTPTSGTSLVLLEIEHIGSGAMTFYIDNVSLGVAAETALSFYYDDKGFRVRKQVHIAGGNGLEKNTYYIRDAAGSPMAIVTPPTSTANGGTTMEHPIYGASRLGVYNKNANVSVYQFTDHLGNVRATASKTTAGNIALSGATDYYPGGMAMPNRNVVGDYRYNYQGQELDEETGKVAFELRLYDPRINRWLTTDPYNEFHSPYLSMGNNWINKIDPNGGHTEDIIYLDSNGNEIDRFVMDGPDIYLQETYSGGIQDGLNVGTFENVTNQLNPSTIRQNLFGLSYPGGDNPTSYNGKANYSFVPDDLSEYPAIGHDRRYDNLGVAGASGLFTDTRAIGADYKFVAEELQIASNPFLPIKTRLNSGTLGVGLGLAALPKTLYKFGTSFRSSNGILYNTAIIEIISNYNTSNHGVTNAPAKQ